MRVHPDFQGRGFGQQILEALEQRALDLGYSTIVLDTTPAQARAQGLYKKNGYVETDRIRQNDFDLILLEKKLR
jgi:ribosomal protein S18 acetylase RimI-like enzyme